MLTLDATPNCIPSLLAGLSPARRALLQSFTPGPLAAALADDIAHSLIAYCGIDEDSEQTVTLGGVMATGQAGIGYVWQIITPAVAQHKRDYILQGRSMIGRFHTLFASLVVAIEPDNSTAKRHAERLGWAQIDVVQHRNATAELWQRRMRT